MGFEARARTGSTGEPYSAFSHENLRTGGLAGIIDSAAKVEVDLSKLKDEVMSVLLASDKYSMIAMAVSNDFDVAPGDTVKVGTLKGFKIITTDDGEGYKAKGSSLFKL